MKILVDTAHPAHVHLFRPFAGEMETRGHTVLFTYRPRGMVKELLEQSGFRYVQAGKYYRSLPAKIAGLIINNLKLLRVAVSFKPDILISHGSISASHVAFLIRRPHIAMEDTFNSEQIFLYRWFTSAILTGDYPHPSPGSREITYSGYHELAYLHPVRFTASKYVIQSLGLRQGEKFVIIRFVSWTATHDIRQSGFSQRARLDAVAAFSKYARVFISSESDLPEELERYRLKIAPELVHHLIAGASLIFGESATMVTEGAVLGVPGIYVDRDGRYYTRDIEARYGLIYNYSDSEIDQYRAIETGVSVLKGLNGSDWKIKAARLVSEKCDVTAFLVSYIEDVNKRPGIIQIKE